MSRVAQSTSSAVKSAFAQVAVATAAIAGAFLAARSAFGAFNAAIEAGGALNDLASRTGETAGNLMVLQRAFKNAGAGAESVGPVINKLQRAIVEAGEKGGEQAKAFERMGLSLESLKNMTPTEQLKAVAAGLQGIDNASVRSTIAMQLLGRSGGELVPMLRAMVVELETARQQLGSAPMIIDKTNQALDAIGDNFGAIGEKGKEFAIGVLSKIAPALADITTSIAEIDAAGLGVVVSRYIRDFGEWASAAMNVGNTIDNIKLAIQGIQEGNFGDAIKALVLTARDIAMSAINEVARVAVSAFSALGETFAGIFRQNGPAMQALNTLFGYISNKFKQILNETMAELPRLLGGGAGRLEAAANFEAAAATYASTLPTAAGLAGGDIAGQLGRFGDRFGARMAATGDVFNMDGRRAETAAVADKASMFTMDGVRAQLDDLMREPRSAARAAEELKLVDRLRAMTREGATPQAIKESELQDTTKPSYVTDEDGNIIKTIPGTNETTASEGTLKEVVKHLASLNTKLPMPVLT
jgi:hypothetical protein